MDGLQAVEDLALFLNSKQNVRVFKFEKQVGFTGEYIVVNHLPFTFGRLVNDDNILNVNVHTPKLPSDNANIPRLTEIYRSICLLLPYDVEVEEEVGVEIKGNYYSVVSCSQPIEDKDDTYFLNIRVKIIAN